jgi:hypothetical protein
MVIGVELHCFEMRLENERFSNLTFVGGHKMYIFTTNIPTFHSRYIR